METMVRTGQSPEQREAARLWATEVRMVNAALKRRLRATDRPAALRELADIFENPSLTFGAVKVGRALRFAPYVREVHTQDALSHAEIRSEDRRVRDLSPRQRDALAFWLRWRADLTEDGRKRNGRA